MATVTGGNGQQNRWGGARSVVGKEVGRNYRGKTEKQKKFKNKHSRSGGE